MGNGRNEYIYSVKNDLKHSSDRRLFYCLGPHKKVNNVSLGQSCHNKTTVGKEQNKLITK